MLVWVKIHSKKSDLEVLQWERTTGNLQKNLNSKIGSLPENVNFGIKASTARQFLTSSGLPSKKSERTEEKSTEQLAEIVQNQALMVMCLQ